VTATLLNQVLVPVMCLALGPKEPLVADEPEPGIDPTTVPASTLTAS
jgi:hypothetical protein